MNKKFNQNTKLVDIKDGSTLYDFLCYKADKHTHFKIYSEEYIIDSIIEEGALFIGDGRNWNDVNDRKNLQSDNLKIFAKCFSFSKSENVAMWMLYGGIKHKGAMIDLRKEDINNLLAVTEISLGKWVDKDVNNKNVEGKIFQVIKTLKRSEHKFSIELIDILYVSRVNSDGTVDIKRSDDRTNANRELVENLPRYITKSYPWAYENEVRLIIKVDEEFVPHETQAIKIHFSKYKKKREPFRVFHAPYITKATKYELSSLEGKIDWDLCYDCNKKCLKECFDRIKNK